MLYKYFTEKLLGLQDVDIEKIEEIDNSININFRLKRKIIISSPALQHNLHLCPASKPPSLLST